MTPAQLARQIAKIATLRCRAEVEGYRLGLRLSGRSPHGDELAALARREAQLPPEKRRGA